MPARPSQPSARWKSSSSTTTTSGRCIFIQSGDRLPVTTAINNLQGEFLNDYNLLAAGAVITVIPTLIVYLLLQRQFVAGLTLGSSKG